MAFTSVQTNNILLKFRQEIYQEYVRENLFSPYMGPEMNSIIQVITDLDNGGKMGGQQINVPLVARLQAQAIGQGPLVGNEEQIDNYGMRVWVDWARSAVSIKKAQENMSSIDLFALAKPMLVDWGKELQRDEICDALYGLPSTAAPAGLNTTNGQRVNGILFDSATAAQRNTWISDNIDRVLIGNSNNANYAAGDFATSLGHVTSAMVVSAAILTRMKRQAKRANPRIRPYKLKDNGTEWFVVFMGQEQFRDAQNDSTIMTANQNSRAREEQGYMRNPIFVDGDLLWNGMILREITELSIRAPVTYQTIGSGGIPVLPMFLCGQQAMAWCWGEMPEATFRKEDDYQFIRGAGTEMCYGISKTFKQTLQGNNREWGILTAFLAAVGDA